MIMNNTNYVKRKPEFLHEESPEEVDPSLRLGVDIGIPIPSPNSPFPNFTRPTVLDAFSLDSNRTYIDGPQNLKYLQLPSPNASVSVHFDLDSITRRISAQEWAQRAEQEEESHRQTNELFHLIHWIRKNETKFRERRPRFVFYRGLMTKILGTPYEQREGWKIGAIQKNGTIYLRNIDTPEAAEERQSSRTDFRRRKMSSWGYNFEKFLLSDHLASKPDPLKSTDGECNLVFYSRLGEHSMIYIAEIDGVWLPRDGSSGLDPKARPEDLTKCKLVELKTTREFRDNKMSFNFKKFNLRKWWCQSFPVGCSDIVAGLRDDEGVVREVKVYPVQDIARLGSNWTPTVCFNFLNEFLTQVKNRIGPDESNMYTFEFVPQSPNSGSKLIRVQKEHVSESEYNLKDII